MNTVLNTYHWYYFNSILFNCGYILNWNLCSCIRIWSFGDSRVSIAPIEIALNRIQDDLLKLFTKKEEKCWSLELEYVKRTIYGKNHSSVAVWEELIESELDLWYLQSMLTHFFGALSISFSLSAIQICVRSSKMFAITKRKRKTKWTWWNHRNENQIKINLILHWFQSIIKARANMRNRLSEYS